MAHNPLSQRLEMTCYRQATTNSTGTLQTTVFDMTGYEGLLLLSGRATTDADTSSKLFIQDGTASDAMSDTTGMQNITKTGLYLDVVRPVKRFVQGNFKTTASGADVQQIWALRYGARTQPTTQPASTTGKVLYSPGSGTASG